MNIWDILDTISVINWHGVRGNSIVGQIYQLRRVVWGQARLCQYLEIIFSDSHRESSCSSLLACVIVNLYVFIVCHAVNETYISEYLSVLYVLGGKASHSLHTSSSSYPLKTVT